MPIDIASQLRPRSFALRTVPSVTSLQTNNVDFSTMVRKAVGNGLHIAGNAASLAAPMIPGSSVLSAALHNTGASVAQEVSDVRTIAGNGDLMSSMEQLQENMVSMNMYMLSVQQKYQRMSEQYTMLSNVMKAEYDTKKNSISNIR